MVCWRGSTMLEKKEVVFALTCPFIRHFPAIFDQRGKKEVPLLRLSRHGKLSKTHIFSHEIIIIMYTYIYIYMCYYSEAMIWYLWYPSVLHKANLYHLFASCQELCKTHEDLPLAPLKSTGKKTTYHRWFKTKTSVSSLVSQIRQHGCSWSQLVCHHVLFGLTSTCHLLQPSPASFGWQIPAG